MFSLTKFPSLIFVFFSSVSTTLLIEFDLVCTFYLIIQCHVIFLSIMLNIANFFVPTDRE